MRSLTNTKGFTLLEVMIAMMVVAIGLLGIAGMMVTSIRGNAASARLTEATNLAQDKIEELRSTPYPNLYGNCGGPSFWSGGNMSICTAAPANMADSYAAVDNGTNGDETNGDGIWTYHYTVPPAPVPPAGDPHNYIDLIWGIRMNYPDRGLIWGFSTASWTDVDGKVHEVTLQTLLANFG